MDNSKVVKMDSGPFRQTPTEKNITALQGGNAVKANNGDGTGGDGMDPKYATKEEFHALGKEVTQLATKIEGQFETLNAKIDGEFQALNSKIDSKFDGLQKDIGHISTLQWWLMGVVSAGIVIPLITLALKAIFK